MSDVSLIDADGTARFKGTMPGAVIASRATLRFSDFADQGGGVGRSRVLYTLKAGEQLLLAVTRVTVAFDDTGAPAVYLSSAATGAFGSIAGIANAGPGLAPAADGVVDLFAQAPGAGWAIAGLADPVEADAPPLQLFGFGQTMNFDGAAGTVQFTLYTVTPATL